MSESMEHEAPDRDGRRYTRRHIVKAGLLGTAALASAPILAACGGDEPATEAGEPAPEPGGETAPAAGEFSSDTLNIFTWSSYHDPPWIKEYEDSRGVTVNAQLFGSVPEGFAKVQADPGAFDLVLATAGWIENYVDADLLIPVDESMVPNLSNTSEEFPWRDATTYQDQNWGILYNWGDEPLCWLPDKVQPAPTSWGVLWDPQYAGRVSMVDDPTTILPFIPLYLGFPDPYNLTAEEFEQFEQKLNELRPQLTHVSASIDDQTADFANGQVDLGVLYNISTQVKLAEQGIELEQAIPEEGTPTWSDNYVITKASGTNKLDLAYDFIDYTLTVPWQARFIAASSNTGAISLEAAESQEAVDAGLTTEALNTTLLPFTAEGDAFFSKLSLLRRVPNLDDGLNAWNEFKLGLQ